MDAAMVRSFYRLPLKEIKGVLERLVSDETLEPYEGGYIRREDLPLLAALWETGRLEALGLEFT